MEQKTLKPSRFPKNLLEYILDQSSNDDFVPLLTKHHKSIESIFNAKNPPEEIESALFIIELNNFKGDFIKIAGLCGQIQLARERHHFKLANSSEALRSIDSRELMDRAGSFYRDAHYYDKNFSIKEWLPKINGRPFNLGLFPNPFQHNPSLSNEENANNAMINIALHDEYFLNFINTLYGDMTDGENFLCKSFAKVASEYRWIKCTTNEIERHISQKEIQLIKEEITRKQNSLSNFMKKYPATLYLAAKEIIKYLEKSNDGCFEQA